MIRFNRLCSDGIPALSGIPVTSCPITKRRKSDQSFNQELIFYKKEGGSLMMNAVEKPYHEICLNSSQLIVPRDTYQRGLIPARVAQIASAFDERVANEPKISFRDGSYYVMDGQNTIAARKFLNGEMICRSAARSISA